MHLPARRPEECDLGFMLAKHTGPPPIPCYVKDKDLVVPSMVSEEVDKTMYINPMYAGMEQDTLLIFAGGINQTHLTHKDHPESDAGGWAGVT